MWILKLVGSLVTALLLAGEASALDMCFQVGQGYLVVAKSYKKPAPGKCRALTGYEASTAIPHPATGTACLNAFGTKLYVYWNFVHYDIENLQYSSRTELPYPSLTGGKSRYMRVWPSGNFPGNSFPNSAYPCVPAPLP
jgi:hypothetical protein